VTTRDRSPAPPPPKDKWRTICQDPVSSPRGTIPSPWLVWDTSSHVNHQCGIPSHYTVLASVIHSPLGLIKWQLFLQLFLSHRPRLRLITSFKCIEKETGFSGFNSYGGYRSSVSEWHKCLSVFQSKCPPIIINVCH